MTKENKLINDEVRNVLKELYKEPDPPVQISKQEFVLKCGAMLDALSREVLIRQMKIMEVQGMLNTVDRFDDDPEYRIRYYEEQDVGRLSLLVEPRKRIGFKK